MNLFIKQMVQKINIFRGNGEQAIIHRYNNNSEIMEVLMNYKNYYFQNDEISYRGSIVYGNGKRIVNISSIYSEDKQLELAKKCYIFEDGLTSDLSKTVTSCTEQLSLTEDTYIERVTHYNEEIIYIVKQKSESANCIRNHSAIIQNLTKGDYKTISLDNENIIGEEEVGTSFWIA